jgi:3-deoxy-manno-octulosonate cytidylyltransferase (CMP-KDO synthetase)
MTSPDHPTGTDRIAEVARGLDCDIIVNVQGDEPLIEPAMIDEAIGPLVNDAAIPMGTVCKQIDNTEEAFDPNVVKVVLDEQGFALLFSRAPIPWDRDAWGKRSLITALTTSRQAHRPVCIAGVPAALRRAAPNGLETLKTGATRALARYRIRAVITQYESFGATSGI